MKTKKYVKAKVIAKNNPEGSFAAGCPAKDNGGSYDCRKCDRAQ